MAAANLTIEVAVDFGPLTIVVDKLRQLVKEARSREGAHVLRTYTLEVRHDGIAVVVCDRSAAATYNAEKIIQYDALALCSEHYGRFIFNTLDDEVAHGLEYLSDPRFMEAA